MNNYGWENNSYLMEPWIDTQYQDTETSSEFLALFGYHMEKMDQNLECMKDFRKESCATVRRMATIVENFKELSASIPTMDVPIININNCSFEEPTSRDEHLELFYDDDSLSEVELQDLVIEEKSQDKIHSAQPFVPTFIIQDHIY
ncbi:hypothetical protein TIFTF001_014080 [Ficus carica]|uniref:Uncharacterized protein n=1 Tax=Ficus carica TaxID=3494 RepID=A0AA88DID8_FICCA|nr:hypothetical protein TIFTF001_014080 [Ficus carica]